MEAQPPFLASYAITQACNLKCKHCYSDAKENPSSDELSTEEAKNLLDELVKWGVRMLILDGGEPLCREDFFDLARYASTKGLRVVVGSNGTLISEEVAAKMRKAGVQAVAISIDGASAETHDKFRGEKGAFEKAMRGVESCKRVGLPFQFNTVIRRHILKEIPDILKMAVECGASAVEFFDLVQVKRVKEECPDEPLSVEERRIIIEWLADVQRDYPLIIRVPACPMYPLALKYKGIQPKIVSNDLLRRIPYYARGCAAGMPNGYITILFNGDVIPCMLLQHKLGSIRKEPLRKMWEHPFLINLRSRSLLKGECRRCRYRDVCAGCRGRAYEETGDPLASDPGCWLKEGAQE
jgi:radical SAM protein with 4Fe4S-binding SPASM domain